MMLSRVIALRNTPARIRKIRSRRSVSAACVTVLNVPFVPDWRE